MKRLLCLLAIIMPMLSANCYAQDWRVLTQEEVNRMEESRKKIERGIDALDDLENRHCQMFAIQRAPQFQFQNLKGLNIDVFRLNSYVNDRDNNDLYAGVTFFVEMTNREGKIIFEQTVKTDIKSFNVFKGFNEAYTQSLEKINWHKIASLLKESSEPKQLAKEEPRKEVEGYGNTALENTIIRWDVQSRPAGADVFWRVVSKTPSVKSTNNKYLQTTPYEATKSLDIRGLSYENSGDVRVILRCEKEGYYPQEKEFNVRMIIDQEEISAFFKLVKVE